jgi:hypothetical protein
VLGTVPTPNAAMVYSYDNSREQLVVGRPASNIVSLFSRGSVIFRNGFN